ncbi:MAG TPA: hypothetical protein VK550_25415 [Polyangiaceae bacterium]|nr:hypothetical protein [Polyangiaceae bacterium]
MANDGSHAERTALLLASPRVRSAAAVRPDAVWPFAHAEPADLRALYHHCDGIELDDGVRIFGRGELHDVTSWLVLEKGLSWPDDLIVAGERRDIVIALDLDVRGVRAGGGVLEVGADDLGSFERVASGVLDYLLVRSGTAEDMAPPGEIEAKRAARTGDRDALERALLRPMYPGSERTVGALWLELGALHAVARDAERSLRAFEQSVAARLAVVGRGGRNAERVAAWTAAVHVARSRGAEAVAIECERRAR